MRLSGKVSIVSYGSSVGRTTVAFNLFLAGTARNTNSYQLIGYDIEKPDLLQYFSKLKFSATEVHADFPKIDPLKCKYCGACIPFCDYEAIHLDRIRPAVIIDPEYCEACGNCVDGCSIHGIQLRKKLTGHIFQGNASGNSVIIGKAEDGQAFLAPLICTINTYRPEDMISICDLGPGISGFVKAALQFSNFAVIVLNPERGWIKNLQPIQDALIRMGIRYGFLINKYRGESGFLEEVKQVALRDRIPILGVIPYIDEVKNIPKSPARVNSEIDSIFAQVLESILNSIK